MPYLSAAVGRPFPLQMLQSVRERMEGSSAEIQARNPFKDVPYQPISTHEGPEGPQNFVHIMSMYPCISVLLFVYSLDMRMIICIHMCTGWTIETWHVTCVNNWSLATRCNKDRVSNQHSFESSTQKKDEEYQYTGKQGKEIDGNMAEGWKQKNTGKDM